MAKSKASKGILSFLCLVIYAAVGQITVNAVETEGVNKSLEASTHIHYVKSFDELSSAISSAPTDGQEVVIEVQEDIVFTRTILVSRNAKITLQSNEEHIATLSQDSGRHFNVTAGELTLRNITLDGKESGGGVEVGRSAHLIMEDFATLQNCRAMNNAAGGIHNDRWTNH